MRKITQNKKGNINMIVPSVLILVLAAAILFFGIIITEKLRDSTATYTGTAVNESAFINDTTYTLSKASTASGFNSPVIVIAINGTSGAVINSANYTLVGNVLYNNTAVRWNKVNLTYAYQQGDESYRASNKSLTGLATFADFWSIIVLAIVISVVVGILLLVLSNRKVQ